MTIMQINWQLAKGNWQGKTTISSLLIACCLLAALFMGCKHRPIVAEPKKELWTCSMHPELIRDKPGTCPICGMELVKKEQNAVAMNNIQIDDLLRQTDQVIISSMP